MLLPRRPKILCIGDSITELGNIIDSDTDITYNIGWSVLLCSKYNRRLDVINRGFSGYNSLQGKAVVPHILKEMEGQSIKFLLLCFGANDSVLVDGPAKHKYISVTEFKRNLKEICNMFKEKFPSIQTIIITPPPTARTEERNNENTAAYANACRELGVELCLPVVNVYSEIQRIPEWKTVCLCDGLHLTKAGNDVFYQCVLNELTDAGEIPLHYPSHVDVSAFEALTDS